MKNAIEHTLPQYGFPPNAEHFPLMVVLSFVYICNAKCPNCPYNNSEVRDDYKDAIFMSEEVFKRIADQCGEHKALIRFSGGEPMLHPKAVDYVLYARQQGARVGLISNGSCYDEEKLRKIIGSGVDTLEFSVDAGDAETYSWARAGLNWEKLNQNIATAMELREKLNSPTRILASIINQENVDVEAAQAYWTPRVDKVQVRKFLTWGYNKDKSGDSTPYLSPEEHIPCPIPFDRLYFNSRGDATLCIEDIGFTERFANIMDRSIADIWRGPELTALREAHLKRQGHTVRLCSNCTDWRFRSWQHNYWKMLKEIDAKRSEG